MLTRSNSRKKGFISEDNLSIIQANQGKNLRQNLEAETKAHAVEKCCSRTCCFWLVQLPSFYSHEPLVQG